MLHGIVDDWGEANITKLFTETIGVAPQAGMKYYLECWWLDTETGFTGESMWISAICKEGSTAYNEPYVSRTRITQDDVAGGGTYLGRLENGVITIPKPDASNSGTGYEPFIYFFAVRDKQ